jgi:hypothetical protein
MREFLVALYAEHLEEASFLYDQCRHLRRDDETPWTAVAAVEQRLEAHLDALVLGGELALSVARNALEDGDAGTWFAAVVTWARQGLANDVLAALRGAPMAKPAHLQALTDALCQEANMAWQASLLQALRASSEVHPVLLSLAWRRRWIAAAEVVELARRLPAASWPWCQTWLVAVPDPGLTDVLPAGWQETAVADTPWANPHWTAVGQGALALRQRAPDGHHAPLALALVGGRGQAEALLRRLMSQGPTAPEAPSLCVALGLLGDLVAVKPLLACLSDGGLAPHAACGLYLITGAPLFEQVFIADEDTAAEGSLRDGRAWPQPGDGRTFGVMRRQLCENPEPWREWLTVHAPRFQPGLRHRLGLATSASVLLHALRAVDYPKALRGLLPMELWWRHGVDVPWDADLLVAQQHLLFRHAESTLAHAPGAPGEWLHAGAVCGAGW